MCAMTINEFLDQIEEFNSVNEKVLFCQSIIENSSNDEVVKSAQSFLDYTRDWAVSMIEKIKEGDENAFDELINVKDMRNFIHHYAYHIDKFHHFNFDTNEIVNEIVVQMFYHVKKNYRIYHEPHELSLLIVSMRGWIRQKVSKILVDNNVADSHEEFNERSVSEKWKDESDITLEEVLEKCLTDDERIIFDLRFHDDLTFVKMGEQMGKSKDTMQRKYLAIIDKIKNYLEKVSDKEWLV
ncbi:RNA polymerase sigma factor [Bacillus phage Stahl]|uniref:RNA polymerase sigma factor n=2 Tax=Slashvirus TaxID=1921709 RepID=A0A0E3M3D4_9CAUD|nr:RNA polymerase sigma factor [Bacillus phage Stahl]AKA61453.1 RNA polymerase sigma factor [Bacillus phage Stahl]